MNMTQTFLFFGPLTLKTLALMTCGPHLSHTAHTITPVSPTT